MATLAVFLVIVFGSSVITPASAPPASSDTGSPLICPALGDTAYQNKPTLDRLNDAACGVSGTYLFTTLHEYQTVTPTCITYCASCEPNVCGYGENGVTCSDESKCSLCSDGCNGAETLPRSPLTCPAPSDVAYQNKPTLDSLNDAACGVSGTYLFTTLLADQTVTPTCITYCASCEPNVCGYGESGVTCSDKSKCSLCSNGCHKLES